MEKYVRREDLLGYAYTIHPGRSDYFNIGVAESMVLDKIKEIADELEQLPYIEMDL